MIIAAARPEGLEEKTGKPIRCCIGIVHWMCGVHGNGMLFRPAVK